jgi:uncharacterized peroxidase-related enzyme
MGHHVTLYAHLMRGKSPLSRSQREMIAVTVSAENDCFYWINHHGAGLRKLTGDAGLSRALARDYTNADLRNADRAMLDYAVKLTRTPGAVDEADVSTLKAVGFDDRAVLDICQVTAYFNYVNRLADGVGVELEEYWTPDDLSITRKDLAARKLARGGDEWLKTK